MCGIAGIFDLRSRSNLDKKLLKKMSNVIVHRGPDSEGQFLSESANFGMTFRRLSIVDLSNNGSQPMSGKNNHFTISFNGEIYNHKEIRTSLQRDGIKFKSNTDTESILHGFAEKGEKILEDMVGMWGISVWDEKKQELFLSRDRIGIKPLYYYFQDNLFIYASEIKSILEHPDVKREVNLSELPNYLTHGMSSRNETLFAGIKKLPSGHNLKIGMDGDIKIQRYWHPFTKKTNSILSSEEIQEETLKQLRSSISSRMMSDVPFGVFLSGGVDSSLNVALMAELMDNPIDTYTVGFKELEKFNELKYARQISKQFRTNHHEILIDDRDAFEILEKLPFHTDEPNGDPVCIPLWFLSKLTKESGTTVIQVGEGADEQFAGYEWMLQGYRFHSGAWKYYNKLPLGVRKLFYKTTSPILNKTIPTLAVEYFRRASCGEYFNWSGVPVIPTVSQEQLFTKKYQELSKIPAKYAEDLHHEAENLFPDGDYFQHNLYLELTHRLSETLLMRVDKIGMAHSLEARVPFLDHRLVEFTMSIPLEKRVPDTHKSKYILKKAVENILPENIIYRKKMGFAAPVDNWFRGPWREYAKEIIMNSFFVKENIFEKSFIEDLFKKHDNPKSKRGNQIYALLNLCLWHKTFF
jgi:asparagine synthase (glutamine-hydrolysing)